MFYWCVRGRHVVLTDDEETSALERAGLTPSERIGYRVAGPNAAALQQRVGRWLESYAATSPREFELDFVERRGIGPESLAELQALVQAYGLTTGRAHWGWPTDVALADSIGSALWLGKRPDAAYLTLTAPTRRWWRTRLEPTGLLAFPAAEIEKFAGNEHGFVLLTSSIAARFGPDLVRIVSAPDERHIFLS